MREYVSVLFDSMLTQIRERTNVSTWAVERVRALLGESTLSPGWSVDSVRNMDGYVSCNNELPENR